MQRLPTNGFLASLLLLAALALPARATEPSEATATTNDDGGRFNLKLPTMGGKQFWTDELVFRDWRIQRHALSGHYRLLDDENSRRAWGTFEHCQRKLAVLRQKLDLQPVRGKVVIALHGVVRSRSSMTDLCEYLAENGDYVTVNVSYASTRAKLGEHAAALAKVVENLDEGVTEINFIAHSLGNLVIRRYLHDCYAGIDGQRADPRIGRFVMLAPPNNGSQMAEFFRTNPVFQWVWGESTIQLAEDWNAVEKKLATPRCEFGIIAGGREQSSFGLNALLAGNDDFVVTVEETRLPGARDFAVLPVYHGTIMNDEKGREYALRFLRQGCFIDNASREPISEDTDDGDSTP